MNSFTLFLINKFTFFEKMNAIIWLFIKTFYLKFMNYLPEFYINETFMKCIVNGKVKHILDTRLKEGTKCIWQYPYYFEYFVDSFFFYIFISFKLFTHIWINFLKNKTNIFTFYLIYLFFIHNIICTCLIKNFI